MLDCSKVSKCLLSLCEEQSLRLRKSLDECVNEALTDWIEAQTGKTILELVGVDDESNDDRLSRLTMMAQSA